MKLGKVELRILGLSFVLWTTFAMLDNLAWADYPPVRLTDNSAESARPRSEIDADYLYVAWEDTREGNREIYWQKFTKMGQAVTDPVRLCNTSQNSVSPQIGIDGSGNSYIVWQEDTPYGTIYGAKVDPSGQITVPPTSLSPYLALNPDIAVSASATVWVAFERWSASDHDVYVRRFDTGFVQQCERRLNKGTLPPAQKHPAISVGYQERCYVFWQDLNTSWQDGIWFIQVTTECSTGDHRLQAAGEYNYASASYSGAWPWANCYLGGNVYNMYGNNSLYMVNDVNGTASHPRVGDDPGMGYSVWHDSRDGNTEIYLSQFYANTPYSDVRLTEDPASSTNPDIATYTPVASEWWVVWQDNRDGNWEIYMTTSVVPEFGMIDGLVSETDGTTPIEGVLVRALQNGQEVASQITGSDGLYLLEDLLTGYYDVEASKTGYMTQTEDNIEVIAEQTTTVNFQLSPATFCYEFTGLFCDDFESYSDVDDPEFQDTWSVTSSEGIGEVNLVESDYGTALSLSIPLPDREFLGAVSAESFPMERIVECEVMSLDYAQNIDGDDFYAGGLGAYYNEIEDIDVGINYHPVGQDFRIIYRLFGQYPYGQYFYCGSNIVISEEQWYKRKVVINELTVSFYYDIGDGYQLLCEIAHDLPSIDASIRLTQSGYGTAETLFDNVTVREYIPPTLIMKDGAEDPQPIEDANFLVYKVYPDHSEELLGEIHSDEFGEAIIPSWPGLSFGDQMKIETLSHHWGTDNTGRPEHDDVYNTIHNIWIDNGIFDVNGYPVYDSYLAEIGQIVELKHTTIKYNLVISIEWDADLQYIENLEQGLRMAANYLYDATDGQSTFGTIAIYDRGYETDSEDEAFGYKGAADIRIEATNKPTGNNPGAWAHIYADYSANNPPQAWTTRILYIDNSEGNADLSFSLYPYNWSIDHTSYEGGNDRYFPGVRAIAHELGHYLYTFGEEYRCNCNPSNCGNGCEECDDNVDFGLMDHVTHSDGIMGSEMSSTTTYSGSASETHQLCIHTDMSCWDYFEQSFDGPDPGNPNDWQGPYRNIIKPDEGDPGNDPFIGPNNNLNDPTVDLGSQVEFVIPEWVIQQNSLPDYHAVFVDYFGDPIEYPEVNLIKNDPVVTIPQGLASEDGQIYILGADCSDIIRASGRVLLMWPLYRIVQGEFEISCERTLTQTEFVLDSIAGYVPMTPTVEFLSQNQVRYKITCSDLLGELPDFQLISGTGESWQMPMSQDQTDYWIDISDSLGEEGLFTVYSRDDSDDFYFVEAPFMYFRSELDLILDLHSSDGSFSLSLDSLNAGINRAIVCQSIFPVIQDDFETGFFQIGPAFAFAIYPSVGQLEGTNTQNIYLRDGGLSGMDISSLAICKWDVGNQIWQQLETDVDAEQQLLSAEVDAQGTYAAFGRRTSDCVYTPGDCDHNGIPLELGDAIAMIGMYRGDVVHPYECDCPPHGDNFAPTADPNGNCIPDELSDVVQEIGAYRGDVQASGCEDCPGQGRLLLGDEERLPVVPSLKSKMKSRERQIKE